MVTKEQVDKAEEDVDKAEWVAAHKHYYTDAFGVADALAALDDAWDKYIKLKKERKMVTKEDVEKAKAAAKADDAEAAALAAADVGAIEAALAAATEAAEEAWEEYVKLKEEFENANSRRC